MFDRTFMVNEIKKKIDKNGQPYKYCKVKGGAELLEKAPYANILGMYKSIFITGRKKQPVNQQLELL